MSRESIQRIINSINNREENGGLFLPNIQRYFVWSEDQICKLYDSIMRYYPIGSILVWKTRDEIKNRKFVDNYKEAIDFSSYYHPKDKNLKGLVLDGQQRLQSFYITLKGSYENKELYFNILSGMESNINQELIYEFKFISSNDSVRGACNFRIIDKKWVNIKDVVYNRYEPSDLMNFANAVVQSMAGELNADDYSNKIINNLDRLKSVIVNQDNGIFITTLDSDDYNKKYSVEDVVEVFIRANSGGTKLEKSDLLFSLLTANWEEIEEDINEFANKLKMKHFELGRDYLLKVCLVSSGLGAKYSVDKFRDQNNIQSIKDKWPDIKDSIETVIDFLMSNTFIKTDYSLTSSNAIIPIIYFAFKFKGEWNSFNKSELSHWLLKILLARSFSGSADTILDSVIRIINDNNNFAIESINEEVKNKNRKILVTKENIINTSYGSQYIYLIFSLLYPANNFNPLLENNMPSEDHIFPQSILKSIKEINSETNRSVQKYNKNQINRLGNLMLLSIGENRDEKRAKSPLEWFSNKDEKYLDQHYIPKDQDLWKIENYERFLVEREKLILGKINQLNLLERE
ncbi:MAG: DUF262 domain-containing protein [Leptospiraceae bacterium]|nr:DUF262 domain-containing protein [Leptospiraceae bacterium]